MCCASQFGAVVLIGGVVVKIRDFSRLEFRYAGLTGLFTILRTYMVILLLTALFLILFAAALFVTAYVLSIHSAGSSRNFVLIIASIVFLLGTGVVIFIYERIIISVMNLRRGAAYILFTFFIIGLFINTFLTTRNIINISDPSFIVIPFLIALYIIYASISLFICAQLFHIIRLRSRTERLLLISPQETLLKWEGLTRILGMPRSFERMRKRVKRTFSMMAVATILYSILPSAAVILPVTVLQAMNSEIHSSHIVASGAEADFSKVVKDILTYGVLFGPMIIAVILVIGSFARRLAYWWLTVSLNEMSTFDRRRPVFFMRSFEDDQIELPETKRSLISRVLNFGRRPESVDTLLLEEGTPIGPVVALGNPEDRGSAPFGAAREYRSDESWLEAVEDMMYQAQAIVIVLENSDSIWLEVQKLFTQNHLQKTLFIMHPRYASRMEYSLIIEKLLSVARDCGIRDLDSLNRYVERRKKRRFLGFHFNRRHQLRLYESREYSWISMVLLLRVFFRSSRFDKAFQSVDV